MRFMCGCWFRGRPGNLGSQTGRSVRWPGGPAVRESELNCAAIARTFSRFTLRRRRSAGPPLLTSAAAYRGPSSTCRLPIRPAAEIFLVEVARCLQRVPPFCLWRTETCGFRSEAGKFRDAADRPNPIKSGLPDDVRGLSGAGGRLYGSGVGHGVGQ